MPQDPTKTAHGRYEHLKQFREPYLRRARQVAEVTIPALVPPEGATGSTDLPQPWQSVGARGINNLAAKLLLALFPPGSEFFRITIDDFVLEKLVQEAGGEQEGVDARAEFESALSSVVRAVRTRLEQVGARTNLHESLKQLLVAGNVLLQVIDGGKLRLHYLSDFVVKRDGEGTAHEIITKETISRATAPEVIRQLLAENPELRSEDDSPEDTIDLFTRLALKGIGKRKMWKVHQEVGEPGIRVPDSEGTYPQDKSPFIPLRLTRIDGEDYGRGFGEEYLGDLKTLDSLYRSIVEYSAAAAKILLFVDPGGLVSAEDVANAPSGEVLDGNAKDVSILTLVEKFNDFKTAFDVSQNTETRLEQAFLLMSGVQRNAERVTAEEIRRLANELEQTLGGVYSILAEEMQRPLVRRVMHEMQRRKELPQLPEEAVNFEVVTGLEALGRNQDLVRLDILVEGLLQLGGPEAVNDYLHLGAYMKRRAAALSIDVEGLIRSEQEVQQIKDQRAQQALAEKAAGPGVQYLNQRASEAQGGEPNG
jgi:hypothetical protein